MADFKKIWNGIFHACQESLSNEQTFAVKPFGAFMNIAVITKSASTKSSARVPFELASYLSKYCQVTVFAQKEKGVEISAFAKTSFFYYSNPVDLYKKLKRGNFEAISFHSTFFEMLAARMAGIPVVKTYYGTQFDAYLERFLPEDKIGSIYKLINKFFNFLLWLDQKAQLTLSSYVIAISKACQKELLILYKKKSTLIYLGTDLRNSRKILKGTKQGNGQITLLSVSRITPYKGFHQILFLVKELRAAGLPLKLIIAGSKHKKRYLDYLRKVKGPVDGLIVDASEKELNKLYQKCDLYVSADRFLFFGLPIIEAAQFSKPSLVFNNKAAHELIVHNKTGYVANSSLEFKKYLLQFLKSSHLREKLGQNARNYAISQFNWKDVGEKYVKVFEKVSQK